MAVNQLFLCKRLFQEGCRFLERDDPVSCGLGVSLLQDAVELLVWALMKEKKCSPKDDRAGFLDNIKALSGVGVKLDAMSGIYDLNKARVAFKHNGNLPDVSERSKHSSAAEAFMRDCIAEHFGLSFYELSLADQVALPEERAALKAAEQRVQAGDLDAAMYEAAKAHFLLLARVDVVLPGRDLDFRALESSARDPSQVFFVYQELARHLEDLRALTMAGILQIRPREFRLMRQVLPAVSRLPHGEFTGPIYGYGCRDATPEEANQVLATLVSVALRVQDLADG